MTERQTKFGYHDVNDAAEVDRLVLKTMAVGSPKAQISRRRTRSPWCQRVEDNAFHLVQRLSWRSFAVCQNFSNRGRKVLDAGTGHDDAVPAAVSFFGDAQEFPAVVLAELHVEMLTLDLQFSRLDDVIHFSLRPPTLPQSNRPMEEKSALGM